MEKLRRIGCASSAHPAIQDIQAVSVQMLPDDALLATTWLIFKCLWPRTLFRAVSGRSLDGGAAAGKISQAGCLPER